MTNALNVLSELAQKAEKESRRFKKRMDATIVCLVIFVAALGFAGAIVCFLCKLKGGCSY